VTVDFSAWITELSVLRKHRILISLILVAILWWPVFNRLVPSPPLISDFWVEYKNVDYWSIISHPDLHLIACIGFVVVGIGIFIGLWHVLKKIYWFILVIAVFLFCGVSFWNALIDTTSGRTFEHVMTVQYLGKVYQLAYSTYIVPWDVSSSEYNVFECEVTGGRCSSIFSEVGGRDYPAKLVVEDDKLLYQWDTHSEQVLPKVN